MTKKEFEAMTMRAGARCSTISVLLFETIERYYMSRNYYHEAHGGADETKQAFVKRVYGGKVNTPKTILEKTIKEAQRENRWCLQGTPTGNNKRELDRMDALIADQITWESKQNYI